MSPKTSEPLRLAAAERADAIDGRLACQLRVLATHAPMTGRLHSAPRRRRLLAVVRIAMVTAVVLIASGIATATAAYVVRRVWPRPATLATPPARTAPPDQRTRSSAPHRAAPEPVAPIVSSPEPTPAEPARPSDHKSLAMVAKHVDRRADRRPPVAMEPPVAPATEPSAPVAETPEDGVSEEARLLRQALSALRHDHDARRALSVLDDYDRRFAQGTLVLEATSARTQALLQLGDHTHALVLLDRLPLGHKGYPVELRIVRGELRSLAGRCSEALLDFDAVLARGAAPDEVARALFGRASCRARTGDNAGAEADRRRYLKEFPQGPAAGQLLSPR